MPQPDPSHAQELTTHNLESIYFGSNLYHHQLSCRSESSKTSLVVFKSFS